MTTTAAVLALAAVIAYMQRKRLLAMISSSSRACAQEPQPTDVSDMAPSTGTSPSYASQPMIDTTVAAATQSRETQSSGNPTPKDAEATTLAAANAPQQEEESTVLAVSTTSMESTETKPSAAPSAPREEMQRAATEQSSTARDDTGATEATEATALAARVEDALGKLRPTEAGSEARRALALELLSTLQSATELRSSKQQRRVARAFVDNEGPELVYAMESSMRGNWMADAKNGTMRTLTAISQLPGPIGKAMATYRGVAEKNLVDAAHGVGCEHTGAQPTTVAPQTRGGHH